MAVNLSPIGGVAAQFFDNSGNVLSGGKIFTYAAGTTTPQATYTSAAGTTALANPIILDAAGRVPTGEIWLTDGLQYKFIIKTSTDVQIGSYDNIVGINSNFVNYTNSQEFQTATAGQTVFTLTTMQYQPGTNSLSVFVDGVNQYGPGALYAYTETNSTVVTFTTGLHVGADVKFTTSAINASAATDAEQVSYIPPFTGSVPTNVELKLAQTVSVKDFGAVGNGIADDTAAFTAAFTAAGTSGCVYAPTGTYKISSEVTVQCSFYGDGSGTVIKPSGQHTALIIRTGRAGQNMAGYVGKFTIDFSGVSPKNSDCIGMWLSKGTTPAASSGCNNVMFADIFIWQAYRGIQMLNTDLGNLWTTSFQNLLIFGSTDYGIYIDTNGSQGSLNVSFNNVTCDGWIIPTAKGAYIRGINNVKYFGTATGGTGGELSAFAMLDCTNVDVRLQIEGIVTTGNVASGLIGFINCPTVELSLRSQTNTFNPGVGNRNSYIYLDTNVRNFVLKSFSPALDVFSSGTTYKINCQNGSASNTRMTILDHSVLSSDVLASADVINGSMFVVNNYALEKISTTRRRQALDVNAPDATATNLVTVADYANRPYQVAALYLIQGSFSGNNTIGFTDLVLVTGVGQSVTQTAVAVSSNSINGGHARTYGIAGGFLQVTISPGSGSYIISATGFDQAGSAN
jgi:hypothetical protein